MSSDGSERLLVHLVCLAQEAVIDGLQQRLHGAGFTDLRAAHSCVFRYLDADGCRLSALAELAGMSKQAIGQHLDYLAERGYLARAADPSDRRAKVVRLTPRGLEVKRAAGRAFREMEAELAGALGEAGSRRAREALRAFTALRAGAPAHRAGREASPSPAA